MPLQCTCACLWYTHSAVDLHLTRIDNRVIIRINDVVLAYHGLRISKAYSRSISSKQELALQVFNLLLLKLR